MSEEKLCANCGLPLGERPPTTKYCLREFCVKQMQRKWQKRERERIHYKYRVFLPTNHYRWAKGLTDAQELIKKEFGKKAKVEYTGHSKKLKSLRRRDKA